MANGYNHGSQLRATTAVKSTYYVEQVKVPPLGLSKLNTGIIEFSIFIMIFFKNTMK